MLEEGQLLAALQTSSLFFLRLKSEGADKPLCSRVGVKLEERLQAQKL